MKKYMPRHCQTFFWAIWQRRFVANSPDAPNSLVNTNLSTNIQIEK